MSFLLHNASDSPDLLARKLNQNFQITQEPNGSSEDRQNEVRLEGFASAIDDLSSQMVLRPTSTQVNQMVSSAELRAVADAFETIYPVGALFRTVQHNGYPKRGSWQLVTETTPPVLGTFLYERIY